MKIKFRGFITSKKSELYSDCADNYAVNKEHNKFAISDGVSKSFFPKIWSDVLVNEFVNQKDWKDEDFILECQKEWQSKIDEIVSQPETKWFTKTQYSRKEPALATFVGLHFLESEQKWTAQALGDSFLFFIPSNSKKIEIKLSSKSEPIEFDNFPDYLSSIGNSHKGKQKIKEHSMTEGTFYLMTDALAEWFLNDTEQAIHTLSNIQNQEQFLETIENERNAKRLNDDDSAILVIDVIDDRKKEISYSESEVTFLSDIIKKEEEKIEESKKKEISSVESSPNLKIEDNKTEEQSLKEEDSGNVTNEQIEQSSKSKKSDEEKPDNTEKDEESSNVDVSLQENSTKENESLENNDTSEHQNEEEKSSESIQNFPSDDTKTKSIFDKF